MFSKKSDDKHKKNRPNRNLAQYGLFDVPASLSFDDSDSDIEDEFRALTSGGLLNPEEKLKKRKQFPTADLDLLVKNSLRDIPSDDDLSDGDENDPNLLDELKELTRDENVEREPEPKQIPEQRAETSMEQLLDDRLKMYITAEENAKKAKEVVRARRFNRGLKTLKDLIKQNNAGKAINPDDIPPEVAVTISHKSPPVVPDHPVVTFKNSADITIIPSSVESDVTADSDLQEAEAEAELLALLTIRRDQYKVRALEYKRAGNIPDAVQNLKIVKQFESVINALQNGEDVDLSEMPGPPENIVNVITTEKNVNKKDSEIQHNSEIVEENTETEVPQEEQLITASTVLEALEQRLRVYKIQGDAAETEGNSSKARRMGRIVKQFEQAIKLHKSGKPILFDELPTPPGYAPILNTNLVSNNPPESSSRSPVQPQPQPSKAKADSNVDPVPQSSTTPPKVLPRMNSARKMGNQQSNTRIEKQVALLLARQKEFKEAALIAKRKGEIAQAKELLRTAKGFDKVIDAARGGFPVDMDSLPIPASSRSILDESFEVILAEECKEDDTGTLEILSRLEEQLTKQLKMCLSTRDHHKALGDVPGMNRFENLALAVTRDLDIVRLAYMTSDEIPKYHYENKSFSIVKCCTDLNDNDLELVILRGINYTVPNPKELDTYVKIEFPYPQEDPFKQRTAVIKNTNNPEYNTTYTIPIQRTSRQCLRVFKRHSAKLEVYSRGGFFRSDQLLGCVQIKLQPLETQCEMHESYDLMDGRKKNGGKLEVKIRVRHPMVASQVEHLNEKWLVLNH